MLGIHLKTALRGFAKNKVYTFINVGGLAVGMAFAILIGLWVLHEISYDRFHDNLDRLHQVCFTNAERDFHGDVTVGAAAPYLVEHYPEISHATRFSYLGTVEFEREGEKYRGLGQFVDPDFLTMFSFPALHGDPATALDDPMAIVITRALAERVFGRDDVVGESLKLSDQLSFSIGAVVETPPVNTTFDFEFLVSCGLQPQRFSSWDVKSLKAYVMLTPRADPNEVSAAISEVYNDHNPGAYPNYLYLRPVRDMHLYDLAGGGLITYVTIFSLLAAAILFIAGINFTNLSTARAATRAREIGVKKVAGARRGQLIAQFLIESILTAALAMALAVVLVELLLPLVREITGAGLDLTFGPVNLLVLTAITVATGILAGVYPAFFLSGFEPGTVIRGRLDGSSRRRIGRVVRVLAGGAAFRRLLVISQFTVSIALIIGVLVIFGQIQFLQTMDLGFDKERVVVFNLPSVLARQATAVKNELRQQSGVEAVAFSQNSLVQWQTSFGIGWEGKDPANTFDVGHNKVDHDYLETFGLKMVAGRFFSRDYPSDLGEAYVVNQACVRAMGITDPVGRAVTLAPGSSIEARGTIVGVIEDYHTESAYDEVRPFILGLTESGSLVCVRVGPEDIAATLAGIEDRMRALAPDARLRLRFFNEDYSNLYRVEMMTGAVVTYIASVAVIISCLGLFGLAAYSAHRRTKEIGVRKVMGASAGHIVCLLSSESLAMVLISFLIAAPIAYIAMNRWLENFAYRIEPGVGTFLAAAALATAITLLTVSSHAIRASLANPSESLRHE